jgi:hypothetical protein
VCVEGGRMKKRRDLLNMKNDIKPNVILVSEGYDSCIWCKEKTEYQTFVAGIRQCDNPKCYSRWMILKEKRE